MKAIFWTIFVPAALFIIIGHLYNSGQIYDFVYSKPAIAPKFFYYYGEALRLMAKNKRAIESFDIVVSTHPDSAYAAVSLLAMADVYEEEKERQKAIELYKKFLRLYPENEKALRVQRRIDLILRR